MKARVLASAALIALGAGCADVPSRQNPERFSQVVAGKSTRAEVRASLGEPRRTLWLRREQRETWGYPYQAWEERVFWIEWSPDGTVFRVSDEEDPLGRRYRGSGP